MTTMFNNLKIGTKLVVIFGTLLLVVIGFGIWPWWKKSVVSRKRFVKNLWRAASICFSPMPKIRVLIVDDSPFIRALFTEILSADPEIEVIDTAEDPFDAREKIKRLSPDVITLDIEMPKMDGLSFLEKIMSLRPMPVLMASSLTANGAEETLQALELGAVDYVLKPSNQPGHQILDIADELRAKVKAAARSRRPQKRAQQGSVTSIASLPKLPIRIIAIGASTGGVEALKEVITSLPKGLPPIVITQHMPPVFTKSLAERLNKLSALDIQEATHGQLLKPGHAYIAKGGIHMQIKKPTNGVGFMMQLVDGENVSSHKPSVDVLFDSVAVADGKHALGIILTGMGKDGAKGMMSLKQAGAFTIGQDEATSLVYGMPKAAFLSGAIDVQLPLPAVSQAINHITGN